MRDLLIARLASLKKEFAIGQDKLQELERQQCLVRDRLMRISGAIQVLEEALDEKQSPDGNSDSLTESVHENMS